MSRRKGVIIAQGGNVTLQFDGKEVGKGRVMGKTICLMTGITMAFMT